MVQDGRKIYATSCLSYSLGFAWFMTEKRKCMDDVVNQDKVVTSDVIHKLIEGL